MILTTNRLDYLHKPMLREDKWDELGETRISQLMDTGYKTEKEKQDRDRRLAKIHAARAAKGRNRISTLGDLSETSFEAW